MVCFSARRLAAGFLVCSVVIGLSACKKDEGKAADGKGGVSTSGSKDLDMIPVDSDVVLGLDIAQAQKSAAFREYALPAITKSADVQKVLETLKTKCNIDPMASASRLTASIKTAGNNDADFVGVLHGIEKSKAMPCIDSLKEELAAQKLEAVKDGDVVTIKNERGALAFTFIGDTTAVIVSGPKTSKERVLEVAQGKSTLKTSKEFSDMHGKLNTSHTLWFLVRGDNEMIAKNLEKLNVKSKAIFGTVNLTDGLEVRGNMRVETEEQATNMVDLAKTQTGMFANMATKFEIDRDKNDVRTVIVMTQEQLKSVAGLLQSFARGGR
jgi:hypothetical protein